MSTAPFTPEQEDRIREIVREPARPLRIIGSEGPEIEIAGEETVVHTPLARGGRRKFKTSRKPSPPSPPPEIA